MTEETSTRAKMVYNEMIQTLAAVNRIATVKTDGRKVTITVSNKFGLKKEVGKGVALCHPHDAFNENLGRVIAIHRAMGLAVPDEFIYATQSEAEVAGNAPQETSDDSEIGWEEVDAVVEEFDYDIDEVATALIKLRRYIESVIAHKA